MLFKNFKYLPMTLDFIKIQSKKDFMEWFNYNLNFPDYFGHNWDDVSDCLINGLKENLTITVLNKNKLYSESDYTIFKELIEDFNKERKIKITLTEKRV